MKRLAPANAAIGHTHWWLLAFVATAAIMIPFLASAGYQVVYVGFLLSVLLALGVGMVMGLGGQVNLGQGGFYLVGAYTSAMLSRAGWPTSLSLLAAIALTTGAALIVGLPLLWLRGHELAFATLAFQVIVVTIVAAWGDAGGGVGLRGIPDLIIGPLHFESDRSYALLALLLVTLAVVLYRNIVRSSLGRRLRALAADENAAALAGVGVGANRLILFCVSGAIAGAAGGMYSFFVGFLSPDPFTLLLSIELVIMVVVGGAGSVVGPILGAGLVTMLLQVLNKLGTLPGMPSYMPSVLSYTVYGVLVICVLVLVPQGIVSLGQRGHRTIGRRARQANTSEIHAAHSDALFERAVATTTYDRRNKDEPGPLR